MLYAKNANARQLETKKKIEIWLAEQETGIEGRRRRQHLGLDRQPTQALELGPDSFQAPLDVFQGLR